MVDLKKLLLMYYAWESESFSIQNLFISSKTLIITGMIRRSDMGKKDISGGLQHCWEFHHCLNETKSQCIVYALGIGKECWITNRMKPGNPGVMNGSCTNCQWFKNHNNPVQKGR